MIILGLEDKLGQEQSAISRTASVFYRAEAGDLANPREPNKDGYFHLAGLIDEVALSCFDPIQVVDDSTVARWGH